MRAAPVKVLHINSLGRSGTTLLGALLGQLDGFFFVGELASAARRVANEGRCGCGELITACPTWQAIFATAFPGGNGQPAVADLQVDPGEKRVRGVLRQALRARGLLPASPRLERRGAAFASLLGAIQETTGSRVVVDSTKGPGYGSFLQREAGVELYVVHLVRDPRAVVNSRLRRASRHSSAPREAPATFALIWDVWNAAIELVWRRGRYLQLRYEDFVAHPEDAVRNIAAFVGEKSVDRLPFHSAATADVVLTHSVAGNRSRFLAGEVRIELDDEWRTARRLGAADRLAVAALTWPLRVRYGYSRIPRLRRCRSL